MPAPLRRIVVFCLFLLFPVTARAQISPGPLSKAHSFLSGPTQCTQCHRLAAGTEKLKCLDCHTEIRDRLAQNRGFHAAVVPKGAAGKECASCHSEHNGEAFNLIRWEPSLKEFEHRKTGYPLEGGHAGLACNQCHTPARISPEQRRGIQMRDLSRTFLGLSRDCLTCHADEHHGQLGSNCASCHTVAAWKPASRFDHAKTKYPLTGAHERVECAKCHVTIAAPKPYVKYAGIPFGACTDCHRDPHRGAFAASCQSCHTTAYWVPARGAASKFDHSKTKYPLLGMHASVECTKCHVNADFKKPLKFQKCMDCHADAHQGQFRARADHGECASCHTVNGFKSSTFTVQLHTTTKYPLDGKHAAVACEKCHVPKGVATVFKIRDTQCLACHADVHKGQFSGKPHNNRCEDCHTVQGFETAKFTLAQHNATRFPLTGGHAAVACGDCHKPQGEGSAAAVVPYHFASLSCETCHQDPHGGQFTQRMVARRADKSAAGCEACHSTANWRDVSGFDHSTTDFALVGSHRALACDECHKSPNLQPGIRGVNFKAAPKDCAGCHEDVHARQFAKNGRSPDCDQCHNSLKWKPSLFDHERNAAFSLKGAHQDVPCDQCHKSYREAAGRRVLFYKPTPKDCASCHGAT
jgi:hypothetical protein